MDLIRKLLFYLEAKPDDGVERVVKIEGHEAIEVNYHLVLLAQAGFIISEGSRSTSNPDRWIHIYPTGLTWAGQEFLDTARDQSRWDRAKQQVKGISGGLSLDMIRAVLTASVKSELGL
jgi:hypothetical protein